MYMKEMKEIPTPRSNGCFTFMLFLQGFDQLRVEGLLCDVTLVPGDGDEVFPVHRAMMASASDYFKAMFTGGVFV